jgi:MFS family permease
MSFHQSSVYVGTIAGSGLGAWFAEHYGWRVGFYFFGAMGMLLAAVLYRFLREPLRGASEATVAGGVAAGGTPGTRGVAEIARAILSRPVALLLMTVFLGANFVATIFLMWTPTFLVEKFDFKLTWAGFSGAAFINVASVCSVPLGGWAADRLGQRMAGGRMLVQAAGLLVGSVFVFQVGTTRDVRALLLAMALFGLCKGLYDSNIFAALYDQIQPWARASAAGAMNTVGWGGGALGPLAVGWLARHGPYATEMENMSHAIAWCGGIYLVGAVLLLAAFWRVHRGNSSAPKEQLAPAI